ncbi:MAG: RNA-directed DNA polymerase, partial [Planctomycetes bacterium]|nr:RNA-directed DNA polymerase [Planctomycetota bacterium]
MAFWDFWKKLFRSTESSVPGMEPVPPPVSPPAPAPAPVPATATTPPVATPPPATPPPPPPAGPQPGDFLPIQRDELLKQGEEVRRTGGWMWFGRRDIIPPVSDPRTKLIDRGMLTEGLLSAEELAEMHQVGDEWSKHANRLEHIQIQAAKSAEEAVEADRAARAARKAQKKAEAAERQKQHAEAVARRKATDIMFAGKGVSALLGDRASDANKLAAAGLPVLHTPAELATALG